MKVFPSKSLMLLVCGRSLNVDIPLLEVHKILLLPCVNPISILSEFQSPDCVYQIRMEKLLGCVLRALNMYKYAVILKTRSEQINPNFL